MFFRRRNNKRAIMKFSVVERIYLSLGYQFVWGMGQEEVARGGGVRGCGGGWVVWSECGEARRWVA